MNFIEQMPWSTVILLCLTLGLAPFNPPHIFEKLQMLVAGDLKKAIDWFDLFMHGTPFIILLAKAALSLKSGVISN